MKSSAIALVILAASFLTGCAASSTNAFYDGVRLYREGYYVSARHAFDSAILHDPKMVAAWNNRGVARVRMGDLDGAVIDYTRALQLAPGDAEVYFNRANAYAAAGNYPPAIADYTTATTIQPMYSQAFFNRGTVRVAAGDYTGALADWQWAITLEPDPWMKTAMARGAGFDTATTGLALPREVASPSTAAPTVVMKTPPPPTPDAVLSQSLDVRALVARAMGREVDGDRAGAIADLKSAYILEPDTARRARIDDLLRTLEAGR